ncbi:MAG: RelA/SpoT family protein [Pseudomonadota bacterium]
MIANLTNILEKVKSNHPQANLDLINKAYVYAAREPVKLNAESANEYLTHRLTVADIVADMHLDASCVCSALLHDVIEDSAASFEDILQEFGEEIAFIVEGVTRLDTYQFASHQDREAESFRKLILAASKDIRVVLVKLAERLAAQRMLISMKPEMQKALSEEIMEIYAPLAERLGIQWLKDEFEDLSFAILEPEASSELKQIVDRLAASTDRYIKDMIALINTTLKANQLPCQVSGRRKHLYSLHEEMQKNNLAFDEIQDFLAFRIITDSVQDCYNVLDVIQSKWTPLSGRFKDFIAKPKSNKYQSLHTTVIGPGEKNVEIQIRTSHMHKTAEYGIAAHWLYKEHLNGIDPKEVARFAWLRQLTELQEEVGDMEESRQDTLIDPFPEEVYVFIVQGHVMTLPRGATPVDLAYAIKTEMGHQCSGARVNSSLVPLNYKLQNGDVVDIMIESNHQPELDWLEFVVTDHARTMICTYLKIEIHSL